MSPLHRGLVLSLTLCLSQELGAQPVEPAVLRGSAGTANDAFGSALAMADGTVAIGAPGDDEEGFDTGTVYLFADATEVAKLEASDPQDEACYGCAVDVSGDRVLVGSYRHDGEEGVDRGAGYLYLRNPDIPGRWDEVARLAPPNPKDDDRYGWAVTIDGEWAAISSPLREGPETDNAGAVYVYRREVNEDEEEIWVLDEVLAELEINAAGQYGGALDLEGELLAVGAEDGIGVLIIEAEEEDEEDEEVEVQSGTVYVYEWRGNWFRLPFGLLLPADATEGMRFGADVALWEDLLVIGAPADSQSANEAGAVYVYIQDPDPYLHYVELAKLTAPDALAGDLFGSSVAVADDRIVVGAPGDDDGGPEAGSIYVFARNAGGPDAWGLVSEITHPDSAEEDGFGVAVAAADGSFAVGSPFDDDQGDSSGTVRIWAGVCAEDHLCLRQNRFAFDVSWTDFPGETGIGHPVRVTSDTGYFWFFDPDNVELMVKVLDGRPVNDFYWIFYASLTNVEFDLRVTDTRTWVENAYHNEIGEFASVGDVRALPDEESLETPFARVDSLAFALPTPPALPTLAHRGECTYTVDPTSAHFGAGFALDSIEITTEDGCSWTATTDASWIHFQSATSGVGSGELSYSIERNYDAPRSGTIEIAGLEIEISQEAEAGCPAESATSLCLRSRRFEVTVAWEDFAGGSGAGQVERLTDDTGAFWFFDAANLELVVKVLDGRPVNGHFWVFFAALSNVRFTLVVTDTVTGQSRTYENELGDFASDGDTLAIPSP